MTVVRLQEWWSLLEVLVHPLVLLGHLASSVTHMEATSYFLHKSSLLLVVAKKSGLLYRLCVSSLGGKRRWGGLH